MNWRSALLCVAALSCARPALAQKPTVEFSQTVGYSTEEVGAAGTQARAFGEVFSGLRFTIEGAWGTRSETETDVFGVAYPYGNELQVIEAYAERTFLPKGGLFGAKAGRFRTPFGISSGSDYSYTGFLRAPLIRYDDYYALSNNFLEHGADFIAGIPQLSFEVALGTPADVGEARRPSGLDVVLRAQGTFRNTIVGVSHIRTKPYQDPMWAHGDATFTGVDVRWMSNGVQIRGEWIDGVPFDDTVTYGGYVDLSVHRPFMGPVTAMVRAERLDYYTEPHSEFDLYAKRYSAAAKIRFFNNFCAQVGVVHQPGQPLPGAGTALDLGLTYSLRGN